MKRLALILGLLVAVMSPSASYASHSMAGGAECGERSFDADLIKGRTDSMLVIVDHTVGCKTYHYKNYVGADCVGEPCSPASMSERIWQANECQRVGKLDTVNFFRFYFDTEIDPASVRVSCPLYGGPD